MVKDIRISFIFVEVLLGILASFLMAYSFFNAMSDLQYEFLFIFLVLGSLITAAAAFSLPIHLYLIFTANEKVDVFKRNIIYGACLIGVSILALIFKFISLASDFHWIISELIETLGSYHIICGILDLLWIFVGGYLIFNGVKGKGKKTDEISE